MPNGDVWIDTNMDGVPIWKSRQLTFWPILGKVTNANTASKPFVIGIYCGEGKPEDPNEFMQEFIDEYKKLCINGLKIKDNIFKVRMRGCIMDCPARAMTKNTKGHAGYSACEKCTIYGSRPDNKVVFDKLETCLPRTDEDFAQMSDPEHHNGRSSFHDIVDYFRAVSGVPYEPMHLIYLGVFKTFFLSLVTGTNYSLRQGARTCNLISNKLVELTKYIPRDFTRKTRSLIDIKFYKAVEHRLILLYVGIVAFQGLVSQDVYQYFLLLSVGTRIYE